MNWREFKPTISFLLWFISLYLTGNFVYGLYVSSFGSAPDPLTESVTNQVAWCLRSAGWESSAIANASKPTVELVYSHKNILSIYEGCSGVNVMIIFISFVIAFGPVGKNALWFILLGILLIHLGNLLRITMLFFVVLKLPSMVYFSHKYLFTATIYAVVFLLWMIWVKYFSRQDAKA